MSRCGGWTGEGCPQARAMSVSLPLGFARGIPYSHSHPSLHFQPRRWESARVLHPSTCGCVGGGREEWKEACVTYCSMRQMRKSARRPVRQRDDRGPPSVIKYTRKLNTGWFSWSRCVGVAGPGQRCSAHLCVLPRAFETADGVNLHTIVRRVIRWISCTHGTCVGRIKQGTDGRAHFNGNQHGTTSPLTP